MFGDETATLVSDLIDQGVHHIALLVRHSAREFDPDKHDLLNPLTDDGRSLAVRLGQLLPKSHTLRAYASPPARCIETAECVLTGHAQLGGPITRVRPVEGLGVFYILDQMKMYRMMRQLGGLAEFMTAWVEDRLATDAMMHATDAAHIVSRVVGQKLDHPVAKRQIDLCVSHDMTLHLVRDRILGETPDSSPVEFLDALALFQHDGRVWIQSQRTPPVDVSELFEDEKKR